MALSRVAHQLWDSPLVLDDPVALRLVGAEARAALERGGLEKYSRLSHGIRAYPVARSRFAEDQLAETLIDRDCDAINGHFFAGRRDGLQMGGGAHLLCAIR